jgi:L-histidine Nalpha-methyltransferase / hercynylcysteine S-oxide synthase
MMQFQVPSIVDIRKEGKEDDYVAKVRAELVRGLQATAGRKTVPTVLLYDERGLKIYDKITTDATEYYVS